jgi:plastocyanin
MSRARRLGYLAVGLMLSTVATACGSSSSGGTTPSPSGGHTVTIKGFAFNPSTLTVPVGAKVTFVMADSGVQHNVTSAGSPSFQSSANLNKGQSYTVTFTKAGTYKYSCTIHPSMTGTVIVQ